MSKGMPSLMALLGLAAVAGYQNRDRLGGLLEKLVTPIPGAAKMPDIAGPGGAIEDPNAALASLIEHFNASGYGATARSWVSDGDNISIAPGQLQKALGTDTVAELAQKTGLPEPELLRRLIGVLPALVDRLTPNGHIPTAIWNPLP